MKRFILGIIFITSAIWADVVTLSPYMGMIDYSKDSSKSIKDSATVVGSSFSIGNLGYLFMVDYSHFDAKYKDSNTTTPNIKQDDLTLAYGRYYDDFMFKVGYHYISTTDEQLGDANIFIASLGKYKWFGYDKLSYGLEGYYSYYNKGHDENYLVQKSVNVIQFTPYITFYKAFNLNLGNALTLKANYQITSDYLKKSYTSFEISDTIYYNSLFVTLKVYDGEMKTGIKDGGMVVFNTLDLMKTGYEAQVGYFINNKTSAALSYENNKYREYDQSAALITADAVNSIVVFSLSCSF